MQSQDGLEKLLKSKKYQNVSIDAVRRVYADATDRYPPKEADKQARAKLHQITGAFMTPEQIKKARACLNDAVLGDAGALERALGYHASTRERPNAREMYARVFAVTGKPGLILDLACGLNPLVLGDMGLSAEGYDISVGETDIINDWAKAFGWDVKAAPADLITARLPKGDLALFMKLLPVLERQKRGAAGELLYSVKARWKLVTFPTRTLGGRGVGMERHYGEWFEPIAQDLTIVDKFTFDDELCYILEDANV